MADLVVHREKFVIPIDGVEIRVSFTREDAQRSDGSVCFDAWYECVTCEKPLLWHADMKIWACTECGFDITAREASEICERHIQIVKKLQALTGKARKRGWLWRLFLFWKKEN